MLVPAPPSPLSPAVTTLPSVSVIFSPSIQFPFKMRTSVNLIYFSGRRWGRLVGLAELSLFGKGCLWERTATHIACFVNLFYLFIYLFKKENKNTNKPNKRMVKSKCSDLNNPALERYQARRREVDECFIPAHPPTLSLLKNWGMGSSESVWYWSWDDHFEVNVSWWNRFGRLNQLSGFVEIGCGIFFYDGWMSFSFSSSPKKIGYLRTWGPSLSLSWG